MGLKNTLQTKQYNNLRTNEQICLFKNSNNETNFVSAISDFHIPSEAANVMMMMIKLQQQLGSVMNVLNIQQEEHSFGFIFFILLSLTTCLCGVFFFLSFDIYTFTKLVWILIV